MDTSAWLTIKDTGSMRLTKGQPSINWDEVSIKINVVLPNELFNRPRLKADITIPKEAALPTEITAETVEDCKEAIKQATGLEMSITVVKPEEE